MRYRVRVRATTHTSVDVDADSSDQAMDRALEMAEEGVLDFDEGFEYEAVDVDPA